MKTLETRRIERDPGPRAIWRACAAGLATAALVAAAFAAAAATAGSAPAAKTAPVHPYLARSARQPIFTLIPHKEISAAELDAQATGHRTIPFWRDHVQSPLRPQYFTTTMAGDSPRTTHVPTVIQYVPIVARIHFTDGTVLDPTVASNCDTVSPQVRFFNSPLFQRAKFRSNGVNVSEGVHGGTQFVSAFQRANYWSVVQGTQYGIDLEPAAAPVVVDILAPVRSSQVFSFPIHCPNGTTPTINLGTMDINAYDTIVENLIGKYSRPDQLPVVLTYNFVQTAGGCCIIGYHNAIPVAGGTQTYAVGTYNDPDIFTAPIQDIYAWTHEMSEWLDDPFVQAAVGGGGNNDVTPPWGHTGQVGGCQTNLETGDPLTGVATFHVQGAGGFIYTYQDEAFHDWFYRTPASGTGGKFSFKGVFSTDAGPRCH
ncbi:MAG: hypothetical protein ACR2FH_10825 [Caulobacteraceae bacterium]